jgi:hypothetical protein
VIAAATGRPDAHAAAPAWTESLRPWHCDCALLSFPTDRNSSLTWIHRQTANVIKGTGDTEVTQQDSRGATAIGAADHDVGGLDVAVQQAAVMGMV